MAAEEVEYELQQLVSSDEESMQINPENVTSSESNPTKNPGSVKKLSRLNKSASDHSYRSSKVVVEYIFHS